MRRRPIVAAAAAALCAGAAHAQRVDVDPARTTSFLNPILTRPGELIASEISDSDHRVAGGRRAEEFAFPGRAGEVVTAQVRSDIPDLEVVIMDASFSKLLARGPAKDAPLRVTLPKAGTYYLSVASKGHVGKYLLALGSGDAAPPFDPPKPAPVRVAEAPTPAPPAPLTKPAVPSKPAAPSALPKLTPPAGVLAAEVGKTIARPAGKPGTSIDVYAFIGEAGAILQADAVGAGRYGVTLYTPEGAEMLTVTGAGSARLSAVLPKDAVYILAVARQDRAKPYRLSLAAESPDIFQWSQRQGAGYEQLDADGKVAAWTCWVAPGSVMGYHIAGGRFITQTVNRGGSGRVDGLRDGKPAGYTFTTRIEGSTIIRTTDDGKTSSWSIDQPPPLGAYRGYLCP